MSSGVCADQPIAKPIIALGQWKRVLADVAKGLARRPNVVADDFKDRITDRAAVQDFLSKNGAATEPFQLIVRNS